MNKIYANMKVRNIINDQEYEKTILLNDKSFSEIYSMISKKVNSKSIFYKYNITNSEISLLVSAIILSIINLGLATITISLPLLVAGLSSIILPAVVIGVNRKKEAKKFNNSVETLNILEGYADYYKISKSVTEPEEMALEVSLIDMTELEKEVYLGNIFINEQRVIECESIIPEKKLSENFDVQQFEPETKKRSKVKTLGTK